MSCGIYKITNLVNGKVYIGLSTDIKKRWKDHIREAFKINSKSYNYPLYLDIRDYGKEKFSFVIIEECLLELLDEKEIYYISLYESYPPEKGKGYNQTLGGLCTSLKVFPYLEEITKTLKESNLTQKEIALKFSIGEEIVQGINTGRYWRRDNIEYPIREGRIIGGVLRKARIQNYCPICGKEIWYDSKYCRKCTQKIIQTQIPSKEEILKSFYELRNCQKVADKLGVSTVLLKKWRKELQLPEKVKDTIELYEREYLGVVKEIKALYYKKIYMKSLDGEIIKIFNSKPEAAQFLGLSRTSNFAILNAIKNNKIYKGYLWELEE